MSVSFTLNLKFDPAQINPDTVTVVRKSGARVTAAAQGSALKRAQLKGFAENEGFKLQIKVPGGPTITQALQVMRNGERIFVNPVGAWSRYLTLDPTISINAAQVVLDLKPVAELETRNILVAQGIQFTNADMKWWPYLLIPDAFTAPAASRSAWPQNLKRLKDRAPLTLSAQGTQVFELISTAQRVKFHVEVALTKEEFIEGLEKPNLHVVYMGHARYGRGPCFGATGSGPRDAPGENWENGTDPPAGAPAGAPGVNTGIFRMGYPYMAVPLVMDVIEHGYTVNLVDVSEPLAASQCESLLAGRLGDLSTKTVGDIDQWLQGAAGQAVLKSAKLPLTSLFSDHVPGKDLTRKLRCFDADDKGSQPHVVIHAGWNDPATSPSNIGSTNLACRVFCHFGCDSKKHNAAILRDSSFRAWKKTGDQRFAYFTTAISDAMSPALWLYHLFTYAQVNNFSDWKPSLDYALGESNKDLADFIAQAKTDDLPLFGLSYRLAEI